MSTIGAGVRELRAQDSATHYRAVYVAKIEGKVHVLHAFTKNQQKTPKQDIELAKKRLKDLMN